MKPEILRAAGECLHGKHWQVPLSKDLCVNQRTVRGWMQATRYDAPDSVAIELIALLKARQIDIKAVLPQLAALEKG